MKMALTALMMLAIFVVQGVAKIFFWTINITLQILASVFLWKAVKNIITRKKTEEGDRNAYEC